MAVQSLGTSKVQNQQVNGQANYKRAAPIFHCEDHRMYVLVVASDYQRTARPLKAVADAKQVEELAKQCGAQRIVALHDDQCTKEAVLDAIRSLGSKSGPDDYFIFWFSGHGAFLRDGDDCSVPVDGQSEAFVLVDADGQVGPSTVLSDDEFSNAVLAAFPAETRLLLITDLCHGGAVVDLARPGWSGRQALLLAGSRPFGDSSLQGIFPHALLLAVDKLSRVGRDNYSVGMLYNATLYENELVFSSKQDITIQASQNFSADEMAWPLVPPVGYQAPLSKCAGPGGVLSSAATSGVPPALLRHVAQEALNAPVPIEEYLSHVQGQALLQLKPCRACSAGCAPGQCAVQ